MPHKASSSNGEPKLSDLLPKRIAEILGERPTLPFESNDDFDALLAEFIAALDPKEFMDWISVKEIADAQWDILRMRGWRRAAIEKGLPDATLRLMTPELSQAVHDDDADPKEEATYILRCAARGSAAHQKFFNSIVDKAGVTHHMLNVVAYGMALPTINAIDEAVAKAERRRDEILRDMGKRRQMLPAMRRGSGGPSGPVVDVDPT
jgi:hypothetical protein